MSSIVSIDGKDYKIQRVVARELKAENEQLIAVLGAYVYYTKARAAILCNPYPDISFVNHMPATVGDRYKKLGAELRKRIEEADDDLLTG